jgi:DNA polymerase-3 subunit delta
VRLFPNGGILSTLTICHEYDKIRKIFIGGYRLLHIFIGEDDYSRRQALEDIKKGIGDPAALMPNTIVLDGRTVTPEQLRNACETVPFLAEKRLVVVEGLLERFELPRKNIRKKTPRQVEHLEEIKKFMDIAKTLPAFTELVFLGGVVKAVNPLLREFSAIGKIESFPLLKQARLTQWIECRVKAAGGAISPQAVATLVRFVGNDLWTMANEVEKLVLYAAGRCIEEADVKAVVSHAREESVFTLVDAVLESRGGLAQETLQQLLRAGAEPVYLLTMIARQARIIFLVREMRARGSSRSEIQSKLGLASDFLVRKAWEQSEKYSPARLHELYHRLLETDAAIKTGRLEGEIALNILIAELGQRGAIIA